MALRNWWEDHYRLKGQPRIPGRSSTAPKAISRYAGTCFSPSAATTRASLATEPIGNSAFGYSEHGAAVRVSPAAKAWHHYVPHLDATLAKTREAGKMDVRLAKKHPHVTGRFRWHTSARCSYRVDSAPESPRCGGNHEPPARRARRTSFVDRRARMAELRRRWYARVDDLLVGRTFWVCSRRCRTSPTSERSSLLPSQSSTGRLCRSGWTVTTSLHFHPIQVALRLQLEEAASFGAWSGLRKYGQWDWDRVLRVLATTSRRLLGSASHSRMTLAIAGRGGAPGSSVSRAADRQIRSWRPGVCAADYLCLQTSLRTRLCRWRAPSPSWPGSSDLAQATSP